MFDMLVYCCYPCDERVYSRRLSKTLAKKIYKLRQLVWQKPYIVFEGSGLKPLKEAMSVCGRTTFLLKKEVADLAQYCKRVDPNGVIVRKL